MAIADDWLFYFAFGSNLYPLRLQQRVPSCYPLGIAKLADHSLRFHKRGRDDSGKCDVYPETNAQVIGVVYRVLAHEKHLLDKAEGLGNGYNEAWATLSVDNTEYDSFFYQADTQHIEPELQPYDWYQALVVEGARWHQLPKAYIDYLDAFQALDDPDPQRADLHWQILREPFQF